MTAITVDPASIHVFSDPQAFEDWLARHHETATEVWIKIHKKGSGLPTITPAEAVDICLCWGWIDAIRKSFDAQSFLQRYTPRGRKSIWSQVNVAHVARLTEDGRMTPHGLRHVEAAKADGRWERAYAGSRAMELPADLLESIEADPRAAATFATLSAQNRFALGFRLANLKTEAARQRKIALFTAMLARGETPHPQKRK